MVVEAKLNKRSDFTKTWSRKVGVRNIIVSSLNQKAAQYTHTQTHIHTHAGLHPTDKTFATLIVACSIRRDYADEALLLFERMKAAGHVPDELTYGVIYLFWLTFFWLDGIGWVGGVSERN